MLFSQAQSGELVGTVLDASGATVTGATLEARNLNTGVVTRVTADSAGQYRIPNLLPGTYSVTATATGFAGATLTNINVIANRPSTANLTVQVAGAQTTVEVTEAPAVIDTTTAQIQTTFQTKNLVELPAAATTNNSGVLNLSLLGAGVTSSGGVGYGTGPSIGGQRPTNNNFIIEGTDNNRRDVTGPVNYVSNEAVQEFNLLQNQFSAEFGHSSGGVFSTIIKSGTNQVHGSLYNYTVNRKFNAMDAVDRRQGLTENPRFDYNRLGATVGGPIVKNKLFYFGNFEYNPIGQAGSAANVVYAPTAAGYAQLANIPGVSRTNLGVLRQYLPAANTATNDAPLSINGINVPTGPLSINSPSFTNNYALATSTDWNISDRDQFRLRYVYNRQDAIDTAATLPVFFGSTPTRSHLVTATYFHNFSPTVINELRTGYTRYFNDTPVGSFNFPGLDVFPNITITNQNIQLGPNPNGPQSSISNTYQLVDNVSWQRGRHDLRFGYDGRKLIAPQVFIQRQRGDYAYSDLSVFLLDRSPDDLQGAERNVGAAPYSGDLFSHYAFANDNWRATRNLTINLGIRYEYVDVPFSSKLQNLNTLASVPGVIEFRAPRAQRNNWAPRIGLAYSPGQSGTTSIRAGFGMAYDQVYQNLGILSLPPQFTQTVNVDAGANRPNFLAQGGIGPNATVGQLTQAQARSVTSSFVPDQLRPYSINWNASIQHVFGQDYTAEIRYLGTRGVHLPVQTRINRAARVQQDAFLPTYLSAPTQAQLDALPVTLTQLQARPSNTLSQLGFASNITAFMPIGNSSYHGLATQLTKRFSRGLYFLAAYTWSHNIDDSTAAVFSTLLTPRRPEDFLNLRRERANSILDRRHRFTYTVNYDFQPFRNSGNYFVKNILGNWNLNGIYTYESPAPATVQSGIDANLNGDAAGDRAIVNPAGNARIGSGVIAIDRQGQNLTALAAAAPDSATSTAILSRTVAYLATNPNARYIVAGAGALANAGRNTILTNPINNIDFAVYKRLNFTERFRFDIGAQAFNVLNRSQFIPGRLNDIAPRTFTNSRNFLIPNNPDFLRFDQYFNSNARTLQFVGRFVF